jgi:hypothetical protein
MLRRVQKTERGAQLWFESAAALPVKDVAQKEAACCAFLAFHLEDEADMVRLDISSAHPDGVGVAQLLADQVEHERPTCC